MIYSYFPNDNKDFFLIHPFFRARHIECFFWKIIVLANKLFQRGMNNVLSPVE